MNSLKVTKYLFSLLLILSLALITSCLATQPQLTPLQMRDLQTREYEVKDQNLVMNALLSTLQDDGYIIKKAKSKLGLVNAEKFERKYYSDKRIIKVTANLSPLKGKIKVRVNFNKTNYDNKGIESYNRQILDSKFYQDFFIKLDKSIFLAKEKI
jgi:hypothetical protein